MRNEIGLLDSHGALAPSVPRDVAAQAQRRRLIDAMAAAAAERTFASTTIADVVGHAGVSRGTFYKRFKSKRECFDAAIESFVEEAKATVEAVSSRDDPPPEAIRKACAALLDRLASRPSYAKLTMVEAVSVDPAIVERNWQLLLDAFEAQWAGAADPERLRAESRVALARAQVLIGEKMVAGEFERLPDLLPELVYIALLPFAGQEEALRQAQMTG